MKRPELELLKRDESEVTQKTSEFRTVREVLAGDINQFQALVTNHHQGIFGLVLRQVNDTALAEELTQEIFVRSYLHLDQFRFESSFNTWLTGIAINHTNSYFASKRFHQSRKTESLEISRHDRAHEEQQEREGQKELLTQFTDALSHLDHKFREVIVLYAIEGKSYEEVACILKIPMGTVRSRLNKGRKKLKHILEDKGYL